MAVFLQCRVRRCGAFAADFIPFRESEVSWYAIRTIYHFDAKADGTNVFEERVVCFEASDWPEAHAKARAESAAYCEAGGFVAHPVTVGYEQDGEKLIDGYEIWSQLFEAKISLQDFFTERYAKYEHHPE